jgi:hypothetical protein
MSQVHAQKVILNLKLDSIILLLFNYKIFNNFLEAIYPGLFSFHLLKNYTYFDDCIS